MFLFHKKQEKKKLDFDRVNQYPVIRCSICNGEQAAGFRDQRDGSFQEVMLIRSESDLKMFQEMCGVSEIKKEY